jgi:hypothetical protein
LADYEVTWSMTGVARITAADDLGAKTVFDALDHDEVVDQSSVQECRVLATQEVP